MAKDVYALFGGRLKSLQNAATKIESGVPFSSKQKSLIWPENFYNLFYFIQLFDQQFYMTSDVE